MKTILNTIWTTYKQSWKRLWSLRALWIILADSAFYLLLILTMNLATSVAAGLAGGVIAGMTTDAAEAFVAKIAIILAIAAVIAWIVWTVTRAIVWQLLAWTRFTPRTWARFFGFNAIWTAIMALPVWLLARRVIATAVPGTMVSPKIYYLHFALILLLAYFGYNVFYAFVKEKKVFAAYKKGFLRAFLDAAYLAPAFIALAATMWLLGQLNWLIARLPDNAGLAVSYLVLFGSLTWAKIYFYDVLDSGAREQKKKRAAMKKPAAKKPGNAPAPKRQRKRVKRKS